MTARAPGPVAALPAALLLVGAAWGGVPGSAAPPEASASAPQASAPPSGTAAEAPPEDTSGRTGSGGPQEPEGADRRSAYQRHFDAGIRLHDAGKYDAALLEFEAAYAAEPAPGPLVNMALCHERLDSPERPHPTAIAAAVAKLRQVLTDFADSLPDERRRAVEAKLASLTPLLGKLQLRLSPASARVTIGRVAMGQTQWTTPLDVRSGTWLVRAEAEGFASVEHTVKITSGATTTLDVALEPTQGELVVAPLGSDAYVEVDREHIRQGQWQGMLSPGSHEVRVFRAGGAVHTIEVAILAGRSYRITQQADGALTTNAPTLLDASMAAVADGSADAATVDPPATTGFELLATSAILVALHRKVIGEAFEWLPDRQPVGVALGVRGGYRAIDWLGFLLGLEYGVTWGDGSISPRHELQELGIPNATKIAADYTLHSWRLTGGLRAVLPHDASVRFVAEASTGVVLAAIGWDTKLASDPNIHYFDDALGLDFLVGVDVGVEVDIDGLLVDVMLQNWLQTTRGLKPDGASEGPFGGTVAWFLGPALRPGFKFF